MRAVNLIPSDLRGGSATRTGRSEGGAQAVLVVLGGLALLAFLYGTARHDVSSRRAQAAVLSAKVERVQAAAAELAPYTNFVSMREQRTQSVLQLVDSRFDWAHALHEFGRVLPSGASITSLVGTVGSTTSATTTTTSSGSSTASTTASGATGATGSSVASATPPGSVPTFTVGGCATSQAEVALTLQRLRLIDGASEVTLQSSIKPNTASGASSGGAACPGDDPTFAAEVTFDPLPTEATTSSSLAKLTSATGADR
jgi:hypothetical protein